MPSIPYDGTSQKKLYVSRRKQVAIAVIGQSNERGNVLTSDKAAWPQAFASLTSPADTVPINPSLSISGGWWHYVKDQLAAHGYDVTLVNGAIGSASFLLHYAGYLQTWVANSRFASKRAPQGEGDRGDFGDLISVGGKVFRCISGGMTRYAINSGPERVLSNTGGVYLDYISGLNSGGTSGASDPGFAGVAIDGTIVDGALTWQRLNEAFYLNLSSNVLSDIDQSACAGRGFDPMGLIQRTWEELSRLRHVDRRIVYICNGQSDLSVGTPTYSAALRAIAKFFLERGCEVMIGLTMAAPGSSLGSSANYGLLSAGVADAIATLQAAYPGKVWTGANLYTLMGTSGPMGGSRIQFSIASNVMTVSTVFSGALEVGQQVATSAGAVMGTISSLGTGTGGTGTYNLTGGTNTASTTGRTVGAFLQPLDGIHVNGAGAVGPDVSGVSCAGKYVADSFKAFLPLLP